MSAKDGKTTIKFYISDTTAKQTYGKTGTQLYSAGYLDANNEDGKLKPEYDAARAYLEGDWRMPTAADLRALVKNCDRKWTTLNGVSGYVVTGKGNYASKGIFLPVTGYAGSSSLYNPSTSGYYWSSTPVWGSSSGSWYFGINSSTFNCVDTTNTRYYGMPIRPVR